MANKKNHRLLKMTLAGSTILGGAALNVPVAKHMVAEYRQYRADSDKADAAQIVANNTPDTMTVAFEKLDAANKKFGEDNLFLNSANEAGMTEAEKKPYADHVAEDRRLIDERSQELVRIRQDTLLPGYSSPQDQVSLLQVKAEEDKDNMERTGLELAALDGGLAFALKKLLDARNNNKVNSYLEGIEAREHLNRTEEDSYLARYESEIVGLMNGKRSV